MSRNEAVVLGARLLGSLLTVWALSELLSVPTEVYSLLRDSSQGSVFSTTNQYWLHRDAMVLGFTIVRFVGFSLTARWLYRGGPEVADFLLPVETTTNSFAENS
jgi:hypothetical protein